ESLVEKLDSERSSIFRRCKLEQIELPMEKGSLDDVSLEDVESLRPNTSSENDMDVDTENGGPVGSQSQVPRSQDWKITVDFSDLDDDQRQALPSSSSGTGRENSGSSSGGIDIQRLSLQSQDHPSSQSGGSSDIVTMEQMENEFLDRLRLLSEEIDRLAPNMKAIERLD
ncbi:Structural maintenance of chromosomes protein 1, partial [Haplosporangium bisporale]